MPASSDSPKSPDPKATDETRRLFREALDRKKAQRHASENALERDGSEKSHGSDSSTKSRTFRRKTG